MNICLGQAYANVHRQWLWQDGLDEGIIGWLEVDRKTEPHRILAELGPYDFRWTPESYLTTLNTAGNILHNHKFLGDGVHLTTALSG